MIYKDFVEMRKMSKIKLGFMQGRLSPKVNNQIQSFPFKYWKQEFSIAKKIKLDLMEWTIDNHKYFSNPLTNKSGINQIKKLKDKFKIKINSATCDFLMEDPFFIKRDRFNQEKKFFNFLENCFLAKIKIIVVPLVDGSSIKNLKDERNLFSFFNGIEKYLKSKKIQIAFESDYDYKDLKKFIEKFDPKIFGLNYDIGNSAGKNYDYKMEFKSYFNRIINVHIKDKNKNDVTVPLFSGKAQILEILRYFISKNYNGNYILQPARSNFDHVNMINNYRILIESYVSKI